MDKFLIKGGKALRGLWRLGRRIRRFQMAAALLTAEPDAAQHPERNLITMSKLLAFMDAKVSVTEVLWSDYVIVEAPD
jgi:hypothetical protein